MLKDYGLLIKRHALTELLASAKLVEDKTPNEINDRREYYRTVYLKTEHWRNLKRWKLKMISACEFCQSESNLDVHHRHYKNLYDVSETDLAVLCRKCHDDLHSAIDPKLRGDEKEAALEVIFNQKCPPKPAKLAPIKPGTASARRRFERALQRMICVATRIKERGGPTDLTPKIRKLFRKVPLDIS